MGLRRQDRPKCHKSPKAILNPLAASHRLSPFIHAPAQRPNRADNTASIIAARQLPSFNSSPAVVQNACRAVSEILRKKGQCCPPPAKIQFFAAPLNRNSAKNHCVRMNTTATTSPATPAFNHDTVHPPGHENPRNKASVAKAGTISNKGNGGGI